MLTEVSTGILTKLNRLNIVSNPLLVTIPTLSAIEGEISSIIVTENPLIEQLDISKLTTLQYCDIEGNENLSSISLTNLNAVTRKLEIRFNSKLSSIDLSNLVSVGADSGNPPFVFWEMH